MPFIIQCDCGEVLAQGDCTTNQQFLAADEIKHVVIENGRTAAIHTAHRRAVPISFDGVASRPGGCHPSEACVVWEHPLTGEVAYPPQNDVPMPKRYRDRGFARKEMRTIHEIHRFEREKKVLNEKMWFDGNGRGFEGSESP